MFMLSSDEIRHVSGGLASEELLDIGAMQSGLVIGTQLYTVLFKPYMQDQLNVCTYLLGLMFFGFSGAATLYSAAQLVKKIPAKIPTYK